MLSEIAGGFSLPQATNQVQPFVKMLWLTAQRLVVKMNELNLKSTGVLEKVNKT